MTRKPATTPKNTAPTLPDVGVGEQGGDPSQQSGPEAPATATVSVPPPEGNEGAQTEVAGAGSAPATKDGDTAEPKAPIWPPLPTVVVKGPAKGRWRIGRHFTPEPTSFAASDLSEAQVAALLSDPELHVTLVDAPY